MWSDFGKDLKRDILKLLEVITEQNYFQFMGKTTYFVFTYMWSDFFLGSGVVVLRFVNRCRGGRLHKEAGGNWPLEELWRWLFVRPHLELRIYWDEGSFSVWQMLRIPLWGSFWTIVLKITLGLTASLSLIWLSSFVSQNMYIFTLLWKKQISLFFFTHCQGNTFSILVSTG